MATQQNSANSALALDVSSLATSSNFLTGVASAEITFTGVELVLGCIGITGGVAPAVGQTINIYLCGSIVSLATTPVGPFNGVAGAKTIAHAQILNSLRQIGRAVATITTAGLVYVFQPMVVSGPLPKFGQIYVTHNQAGALAAAQVALFDYYTVTYG